ncbi:hypothetical protein [Streptomyces sp. NPDC058373]|uniref:hypothetical protein n=1 Tax=Streptomyces sp. NPDC058373 TaxID=3346465 RepID=UPI0036558947
MKRRPLRHVPAALLAAAALSTGGTALFAVLLNRLLPAKADLGDPEPPPACPHLPPSAHPPPRSPRPTG